MRYLQYIGIVVTIFSYLFGFNPLESCLIKGFVLGSVTTYAVLILFRYFFSSSKTRRGEEI